MAVQVVAGTDVGTIATWINYERNAASATGMQKIIAGEAGAGFWARAAAGASAVQVESLLYSDVDPSFQPQTDPSARSGRPRSGLDRAGWTTS